MEFIVSPVESIQGSVAAPPSKSYTIRAILSGLLAGGESTIHSPLVSRDTQAAFSACKSFGATLDSQDDAVVISGRGCDLVTPSSVVDTLNSGTTIRICAALSSLCRQKVYLTGDDSIKRRPIRPLLDALKQLGVESSSANGCPPVSIEGPLIGGSCDIPGNVSSQYISAILMAAPYAREDVTLKITSVLKSRPYVDLTLNMLDLFGVGVENVDYRQFNISSGQAYHAAKYTVEGDYSSAAFILAMGAIMKSDVTVTNLFRDSLQADKKILDIISSMGAKVSINDDSVSVRSDGNLHGVRVDLSDSPDLVPITSVLGALAHGKTQIVNAAHARLKECDRIRAMATELRKMGADITEQQDGLTINGGRLNAARVDGWLDHRIIMSLAVAGLRASGKTVISGSEHVDVTYPLFKEAFTTLGGLIE
jgi:3-phosphoshikimate 1-carboxyvinyltransferase